MYLCTTILFTVIARLLKYMFLHTLTHYRVINLQICTFSHSLR